MCLFARNEKVAKEDVVCYKVMYNRVFGWSTPYTGTRVKRCVIRGKKDFVAEGIPEVCYIGESKLVSGGFIHSCPSIEDAWMHRSTAYDSIFECIIPKGTEYYEGENGYASERIRFVKRIK